MSDRDFLAEVAARRGLDLEAVRRRRDDRVAMHGKRCPACEAVRPVRDFRRDGTRPDALDGYCRECRRAAERSRTATTT